MSENIQKVLALKYRPKNFKELIGQNIMVETITNSIQLNIIDIKKHKDTIDLQLHNQIYKCKILNNKDILITNAYGQCINSNLSESSVNLNNKQKVFAKKILKFAEIALGNVS